MKIENLNETPAYTAITDGDVVVEVDDAVEGTSANGNPKVDFTLRIFKGDFKGRVTWDTMTITEKTMGRVRQTLEALGISITSEIDTKNGAIFRGKKAIVTLRTKPETYNGVTADKQRVVAWKPYVGSDSTAPVTQAPADDDDIPF